MSRKVNLDDLERRRNAAAEGERRKAQAERIAERDRAEKERRKAQAEIEKRYALRGLSAVAEAAVEGSWLTPHRPRLDNGPRPHPNDMGRKPIVSPAGDAADKGRKWGGLLPGSFETGKR